MNKLLKRSYARYKQKGYKFWYWAVDVHDVLFKGDYKLECELQWLPNAKRALKIISTIPEIKVILYTSTRKEQTQRIVDKIENETGLKVFAINENPDFPNDPGQLCDFEKKFCFDLLLDDKAGFDVHQNAWEDIIEALTVELKLGLPTNIETIVIDDSIKWLHLMKKRYVFGNKSCEYIYSHEAACGGHKIIVVPYRINNGQKEFMLVREHNVLFGINITVITGGVDSKTNDMKKIREQACLELLEESGIMSGVEYVRTLTGIKSADTQYHIFKTNVGMNPLMTSSNGDGSVDELYTTKIWLTYKDAIKMCNDGMALGALAAINELSN